MSARRASRESDTLDGRLEETARPPDELTVGVDLAVGAQVANEVPVQRGGVLAAELLEGRAECDVHRPADLLVEERVVGEAVDLVVEPEGDLTEAAGALVDVQQRLEELLAAGGLGADDLAALEAEADVLDLAAPEQRGEREADLALRRRLERARVDLAVGHVVAPVGGLPAPAFDAEPEVGVWTADADLARLAERVGASVELLAHAVPVGHRVFGALDVAGAEDEVLVLLERHLGVLGVRGGREDDPAPAQLAGGDPLPAPFGELAARGDQALVTVGRDAAEGARVRLRPDGDDRVDELDLGGRDRREKLELLIVALLDEELLQLLQLDVRVRMAPGSERGPIELDRERRCHRRHLDPEDLPRLEPERVRDDQLAQALDSRVSHLRERPTRNDRLTRTVTRFGFIVETIRIA